MLIKWRHVKQKMLCYVNQQKETVAMNRKVIRLKKSHLIISSSILLAFSQLAGAADASGDIVARLQKEFSPTTLSSDAQKKELEWFREAANVDPAVKTEKYRV